MFIATRDVVYLVVLPLVTAWAGFGVLAFLIVLAGLFVRVVLNLKNMMGMRKVPPVYTLETILPSHYVEKVRWCMDRMGLDYQEKPSVGVLTVFMQGYTVPRLHSISGSSRNSVGNSSDILRYLWGRHSHDGPAVEFMRPTKERVEMEKRLDRYGTALQTWVYSRVLSKPDLAFVVWGGKDPRVPLYQRLFARLLLPITVKFMKNVFRLNDPKSFAKAKVVIEDTLAWVEETLSSSPYMDGDSLSFVDITLASLSHIWIYPENTARGASTCSRDMIDTFGAKEDCDGWQKKYPKTTAHIVKLYKTERLTGLAHPNVGNSIPATKRD